MRIPTSMVLTVGVFIGFLAFSRGSEDETNNREKAARFVVFFTSTFETRLATTTITALSTCISFSAGAPVCNGRRRKRSLIKDAKYSKELEHEKVSDELDSSLIKSSQLPTKVESKEKLRHGKKLFTVWTTNFTTLTITSTSFLQGTTVSVSVLCVLAGAVNSCIG